MKKLLVINFLIKIITIAGNIDGNWVDGISHPSNRLGHSLHFSLTAASRLPQGKAMTLTLTLILKSGISPTKRKAFVFKD